MPAATTSRPRRWLRVAAGLAVAGLGAVLVLRPFSSLTVLVALVGIGLILTGAATVVDHRHRGGRRWPLVLAAAWVAAGVAVLVWPAVSVRALAVVAGVSLIVGGVLDVIAGVRDRRDERVVAVLGGAASVVIGVLALVWPDVTVLVVAVVFGVRLVLFGLRTAWRAWCDGDGAVPEPASAPPPAPAGPLRRGLHVTVALAMLLVALVLAAVSVLINRAEPLLDAFYDAPAEVPAEPGVLVRSERFTRAIPDGARAWRILYTTTVADGSPALASGIVVLPTAGDGEPAPVIAWAHGTTGVARRCAPSALADPWGAGAFFALDRVVEQGWALVATDYVGLGAAGSRHPYLVGQPAARSVLDAVRAAHQLDVPDLDGPDIDGPALADETVVWGHSQGGGAALWTGIVAPDYAPDVELVGVAALAPASDVVGLIDVLGTVTGGSIFAGYALRGYADAYDDVAVDDYVRPVARTTFDAAVDRCLNAAVLASALSAVTVGMDVFDGDLDAGPLFERLAENVPAAPIAAPLLVAQGEADSLIVPAVQADYVAARCAAGQPLDYRTYPGLDHVPLVATDSPLLAELVEWTADRLAGTPASSTC